MKRQRVKYFTNEDKRKLLDFLQKNSPNKFSKRSAFMFRLMFSTAGARIPWPSVHYRDADLYPSD